MTSTITNNEGNPVTTQLEPVSGGLALSNPAQLDPLVPNPVALEFQVVGNSLTATAWDAAEPRPALPPSINFNDDEARPLGLMGINIGRFSDDPTGAAATFYSYEVIGIPEPTAFALLLLGLVTVSCWRR